MTSLQKEAGYDEFLAKKIAKGREDIKNGRYVTLAESRQRIEALLVRKEREMQALETEILATQDEVSYG